MFRQTQTYSTNGYQPDWQLKQQLKSKEEACRCKYKEWHDEHRWMCQILLSCLSYIGFMSGFGGIMDSINETNCQLTSTNMWYTGKHITYHLPHTVQYQNLRSKTVDSASSIRDVDNSPAKNGWFEATKLKLVAWSKYPMVMTNTAMENHRMLNGKTHYFYCKFP